VMCGTVKITAIRK
jgi:hypothetical protein